MFVALSTSARALLAELYDLARETRDCHSEDVNTLCCMGLAALWTDQRTGRGYVRITGIGKSYLERTAS